jgi:ATP-dependent helicase YprA (DUF1998 family)
VYSTVRSGIVEDLNSSVSDQMASGEIQGNGNVTAGKAGTRKIKADGSLHKEGQTQVWASGSRRSNVGIKMAVERFGRIAAAKIINPEIVVELERIRKNIAYKENQFGAKRVAVKVEAFTRSASRIRVPNALQRQAGRINVLPLVDRRILYTSLLRDRDIELIKQELSHRELSTEGG